MDVDVDLIPRLDVDVVDVVAVMHVLLFVLYVCVC